jgi:hypothetical protein
VDLPDLVDDLEMDVGVPVRTLSPAANERVSRPATCGGIALGDMAGDGVDAGAGVALQGADGGVAGAGQEHRGGRAVFDVVREGAVAEPVEGPAVQILDVFFG